MTLHEFLLARIRDDQASVPQIGYEDLTPKQHRVLDEAEAKHMVLFYEEDGRMRDLHPDCVAVWRDLLKTVALAYRHHPDYRREWWPEGYNFDVDFGVGPIDPERRP